MKTRIIILIINLLISITFIQAQVVRTINVTTAGTLSTLVGNDKTTITDLTLTGTINDADYTTIKQMTALKDLNIASITNTALPRDAFRGITLNKIVLPTSLTSIGIGAFHSVTIQSLNFSQCPNLQSFDINVFMNINIGDNKIDLSTLEKVRFSGDRSYGTFTQCSAHVILPNNKTSIEDYSFNNFKGSVKLPSNLSHIGTGAFIGSSFSDDIILPEGVKTIANEAFRYSVIKRISLPSSLTSIGEGAFGAVTIPRLDFTTCTNLQNMGKYVFMYVNIGDNKIDLSASTRVYFTGDRSYGTFTHCSADVILPDNKTSIEDYSFNGFKGSVKFPSSLTHIGIGAFMNTFMTNDIILPEGLKTISREAFRYSIINNIVFPSTLTTIGDGAFGRVSIANLDFSTCPNLYNMGKYVFMDTNVGDNKIDLSNQNQVNFSGGSDYGTFSYCSADVILPDNKTTIEPYSFIHFRGSVILSPALEEIGTCAFTSAIFTQGLLLPASLKRIGDNAFDNATIPSLTFEKMSNQDISCF